MNVSKMFVFDTKCYFSQNLLVRRGQNLHRGPQESFVRMELEQMRAPQKHPSSQNVKKTISVNRPGAKTNGQQTEKKLIWRILAKHFQNTSLPRLFHSIFRKSRSLRGDGQLKENFDQFCSKKRRYVHIE